MNDNERKTVFFRIESPQGSILQGFYYPHQESNLGNRFRKPGLYPVEL